MKFSLYVIIQHWHIWTTWVPPEKIEKVLLLSIQKTLLYKDNLSLLKYIDFMWFQRWGPVHNIAKVKLVTVVKGDPKAPFSIATIPRCRGGGYSIPWIAPLYP